MRPIPSALAAILLLGSFVVAVAPRPALARSAYLVHVDIASEDHDKSLSFALPWERDHGGSPFDFTKDRDSDLSLERLRWAWATLKRSPEGEAVTISRRGERTRLTRERGFLVIQQVEPRDERHGRVLIPDYIVETVIRGDGRLTHGDLTDLLARRDRVVLVKVDSEDGAVAVWIGPNED